MTRRGSLALLGATVALLGAVAWLLSRDDPPASAPPRTERATDGQARAGEPADALAGAHVPLPLPPHSGEAEPLHAARATGGGDGALLLPGAPDLQPILLTGRVVDERGAALAGARVCFHPSGAARRALGLPPAAWDLLPDATTGADGRFELLVRDRPLAPGEDAPSAGQVLTLSPLLLAVHAGRRLTGVPLVNLAPPAYDVGDVVLPPGASVSARIVDERGAPVEGAVLTVRPTALFLGESLYTFAQDLVSARSGPDGRVVAHGAWESRRRIEVVRPGSRPWSAEHLLADGETLDLGDVALAPGGTLVGIVVDGEGRPLGDARVKLRADTTATAARDVWREIELDLLGPRGEVDERMRARTGPDGSFAFHALPAERYVVLADAYGFEAARATAATDGEPVRLSLAPEALLVLTVVDERTRAPVAGATATVLRRAAVEAAGAEHDEVDGHPLRILTGRDAARRLGRDDDGAGLIVAGPAGPGGHHVVATAPGHGELSVELPGVAPSQRGEHALRLPAPSALAGRAVDERGQPVAGAVLVLDRRSEAGRTRRQTESDAQGRFTFGELAEGTWMLSASAEGHGRPPAQIVALAAREQRDGLEVVLARGAQLSGRVLDADGRPVSAPVFAAPLQQPGPATAAWTRADEHGRFALHGLPGGPTRVRTEPGAEIVLEIVPGEEHEVELVQQRAPSLHVRVTDAHGLPLAAEVSLRALGPSGWEDPEHVVTGEDGAFAFTDLRPGRHLLEARLPFSSLHGSPHEVALAWGRDEHVELTLGGATLTGRVVDPSGAPVAGVSIGVAPETEIDPPPRDPTDQPSSRTAVSDADGRFTLTDLDPGPHGVELSADEWRASAGTPDRVTLALGVTEITLTVARAAALEGRLTWVGGATLAEPVTLVLQSLGSLPPVEHAHVLLSDSYRVGPLLAGGYRYEVRPAWRDAAPHVFAAGEVTLVAGETNTLDLVLAPSPR